MPHHFRLLTSPWNDSQQIAFVCNWLLSTVDAADWLLSTVDAADWQPAGISLLCQWHVASLVTGCHIDIGDLDWQSLWRHGSQRVSRYGTIDIGDLDWQSLWRHGSQRVSRCVTIDKGRPGSACDVALYCCLPCFFCHVRDWNLHYRNCRNIQTLIFYRNRNLPFRNGKHSNCHFLQFLYNYWGKQTQVYVCKDPFHVVRHF